MDEAESWIFAFALVSIGVTMILLCRVMHELQQDVELLRVTAAIPEMERH